MSAQYIALVKLDFVPLVGNDDELPISNIGALKKGLQALQKEDAEDDARARQKWQEAKELLAEDREDETGAGAQGRVQVDDHLEMARVGGEL